MKKELKKRVFFLIIWLLVCLYSFSLTLKETPENMPEQIEQEAFLGIWEAFLARNDGSELQLVFIITKNEDGSL